MKFHQQPDKIILYVVPGSQYSTKVLAGLEARKLPHYLIFAPPQLEKRKLPSGNVMVPELEYKGKGVNDSTSIYKYLDNYLPSDCDKFYPEEYQTQIDEIDSAVERHLDAVCNYFNYVDEESYRGSVRKSLSTYIPWFAFWINIDKLLQDKRNKCRAECEEVLPCELNNESVTAFLYEFLKKYDDALADNVYLLPTDSPTIADFALYSKLCRITDQLGDVSIGSIHQDILEKSTLENIKRWYKHMQSIAPLKWKGKRV